jgi:hypothetical protein
LFVFGGLSICKKEKSNLYSTKSLNDLWVYSSNTWTNISLQGKAAFTPRWGHICFIDDYKLHFVGSTDKIQSQVTKIFSSNETTTPSNYGVFNFELTHDDHIPIFTKYATHDGVFFTFGFIYFF